MGSLLSYLEKCRIDPKKFLNLLHDSGNLASSDDTYMKPVQASRFEENPVEVTTTADLILFSYQISRGLEYLSERNIVHRDLAARNVLMTREKVVKVSDFGMARWIDEDYLLADSKAVSCFLSGKYFL